MLALTDIRKAVRILSQGQLVVFPTETVYGLGADAQCAEAVYKIFELKGRPTHHPLIVHLPTADALRYWIDTSRPSAQMLTDAQKLATSFWPGPLTLIVNKAQHVLEAVTGGQNTVALRVPQHPVALQLLADFATVHGTNAGLAAPSANRFGHVSATCVEHVHSAFGNDTPFVLDGGPCEVGIESTIVDLSTGSPSIVRPGAVTRAMLLAALGKDVPYAHASIRHPGQHASHYAPCTPLIRFQHVDEALSCLQSHDPNAKIALLCEHKPTLPPHVLHIALPNSGEALSEKLYALLHQLDSLGVAAAYVVMPESHDDITFAVRDRLTRASQERTQR